MVLMLLEQIVQLFLCIVLGWLLVRLHLLKPEDSRVLSKVCLYLVTPCVIMFQLVQQFPMWSHCRIILSGDRNVSLKKILLNVNIISVFVGVLLFLLNLPLPTVIAGTMKSIASTIGPLSMFVAGMLMGEQNLLAVLRIRSIWKVAFLRLIALPLVVLCIFKYSGLAALVPDGQSILMISLLAASAPAAANVTQIAQVYGHEGDYAGAINVITTLLCIGTMPLMVLLYQM